MFSHSTPVCVMTHPHALLLQCHLYTTSAVSTSKQAMCTPLYFHVQFNCLIHNWSCPNYSNWKYRPSWSSHCCNEHIKADIMSLWAHSKTVCPTCSQYGCVWSSCSEAISTLIHCHPWVHSRYFHPGKYSTYSWDIILSICASRIVTWAHNLLKNEA